MRRDAARADRPLRSGEGVRGFVVVRAPDAPGQLRTSCISSHAAAA
jgi:hypothetical protein